MDVFLNLYNWSTLIETCHQIWKKINEYEHKSSPYAAECIWFFAKLFMNTRIFKCICGWLQSEKLFVLCAMWMIDKQRAMKSFRDLRNQPSVQINLIRFTRARGTRILRSTRHHRVAQVLCKFSRICCVK